jgi:hypothetical protein
LTAWTFIRTAVHPLTIAPFFFDSAHLDAIAQQRGEGYRTASPFPHIVIDDFLPDEAITTCISEFPTPENVPWELYTDAGNTKKLAINDERLMGPFTRHLIGQLNASAFVEFLEKLTGITGLVPDPHLLGGGLHQIEEGGYLRVHADFNRHPTLRLERRLNLLLYLNPGWREEYGGDLQLWNAHMTDCERRVFPVANRCVIFSTTDTSFHGHPDPLTTPPGVTRKSLALYYYSADRPDDDRSPEHSTLYQAPQTPQTTWRRVVGQLAPPAAVTLGRRVRDRVRSAGRAQA